MERAFKGIWIPKEIWLSNDLGWTEKLLLVEIDSLDKKDGCWATNEHFAEFFSLSKDRISKLISSLKKKGYISVELVYKPGTNQIDKRVVRINHTYRRKQLDPIGENDSNPIGENAEENNTSTTNTLSNTRDIKHIQAAQEIFEHFVSLNIVKHKSLTGAMKTKINARLKDYSLEDIKQAITNYDIVLNSNQYYFTHKYTLQDFMTEKALGKFLDESEPLQNFLKGKEGQSGQNQPSYAGYEFKPSETDDDLPF